MNRNLDSPTKLTEFAPLSPEEKSSGFGLLGLSKFFKLGKNDECGETASVSSENQQPDPSWQRPSDTDSNLQYPVDITEGRSLPNVLKRISNLIALKRGGLTAYKDTDLKQYWMPDSVSKECYDCGEKFTTFRRRHHCRVCGQIFCSRCCNQGIPGKIMGCTGDLRVCTYCCKVVLSYLQSPDIGSDLSSDLKSLQEDLQIKLGVGNMPRTDSSQACSMSSSSISERDENVCVRRKVSVGYQEETFALGQALTTNYITDEERCRALQSSTSLRNLFEEITKEGSGVNLQTHRYRLRSHLNCFLGSELIDWLIVQNKCANRIQATAMGQALIEAGYVESISESNFTDGYYLYRPLPLSAIVHNVRTSTGDCHEPLWVKQISQQDSTTTTDSESERERFSEVEDDCNIPASNSVYFLDINLEESVVHVSRPAAKAEDSKTPDDISEEVADSCEESGTRQEINVTDTEFLDDDLKLENDLSEVTLKNGWHKASGIVRNVYGESQAYHQLRSAFHQHKHNLCKQLLSDCGLSLSWSDTILPLVKHIVDDIKPISFNHVDVMDIKQFVQIKKIPGGSRSDCSTSLGTVCSKNIAHRSMKAHIIKPRILLLKCSIVYQRIEGRLLSLEPVMMQEHEYLKNAAARIAALQPDIVIVHKNVSRLAQEFLLGLNITLVFNVKMSVMERIARCTGSDIVSTVDSHISKPQLGTCSEFYVETFNTDNGGTKTLMFFKGSVIDRHGCTMLLRGGSKAELNRLKKVTNILLSACYNWRLEKSYLMDEFAKPPIPRTDIFNEENLSNVDVDDEEEQGEKDKQKVEKQDDRKMIIDVVEDRSDPLHTLLNNEDVETVAESELAVADLPLNNEFRKCFDDIILSVSPYIRFSLPYLLTESGRNCTLRQFFPKQLFYSKQFSTCSKRDSHVTQDTSESKFNSLKLKPKHKFVSAKLTETVQNVDVQTMLALFRASGGRVTSDTRQFVHDGCKSVKSSGDDGLKDVFDPVHHQRIAVLFCSYSNSSPNAPGFCVNPWVVNMDFYGRHDIPLGCFLERYCFRSSYKCPSVTCEISMIQHIRRFVHDSGCVHISLNVVPQLDTNNIVMWNWCSICKSVSPIVPMSQDTWSFSFAKYLELRFHAHAYSRRATDTCKHSLHHEHHQYFAMNKIIASFKFTPITTWEISLPPPLIVIQQECLVKETVMDELRMLAIKGHDIYSSVLERLVNLDGEYDDLQKMKTQQQKDQANFKSKIEEVQLMLTLPQLKSDNKIVDEDVEMLLWKIDDSLIYLKRLINEAVVGWNARMQEVLVRRDDKEKIIKKTSGQEDDVKQPETTSDESCLSDELNNELLTVNVLQDTDDNCSIQSNNDMNEDDVVNNKTVGKNQNEDKHDKKSVKNILSQILTSNKDYVPIQSPWSPQEHYLLPPGPHASIVIYENEPSSIISYALSSYDYHKLMEEHKNKRVNVTADNVTASPMNKRKQLGVPAEAQPESPRLSFLRGTSQANMPGTTTGQKLSDSSRSGSAENVTQIPNLDADDGVSDKKPSKTSSSHIEIQFGDSTTKFYCRVFFFEQFACLRQVFLPIGEQGYVRSLARCVQWAARGGKSGSTFCKTKDDRFVLKEISKLELQLFLELGSHYFTYMSRSYETSRPTLLGKIAGVYSVVFRNSSTNATLKSNLLVMENLFYKRNVTQKYDLKGSVRNRLANPSSATDGEIVYLDENLLKMTCDSPLYILPHSQAVLLRAIESDTQFLASLSVIDYSLLVGLDQEKRELIIGIIDYIRTFTWDKKIETMVKKSITNKLPTIVKPEEYKNRFNIAMQRYFHPVPDRWSALIQTDSTQNTFH